MAITRLARVVHAVRARELFAFAPGLDVSCSIMRRGACAVLWVWASCWALGLAGPAGRVCTAQTARAASPPSVIVLGLQSAEGDDEFTRALTDALRRAMRELPQWWTTPREMTLAQMLLAHGCDDADEPCLADIARTLHVDRVIYGQVSRTADSGAYDFVVTLSLFTMPQRKVERSFHDLISRASVTSSQQLFEIARSYIQKVTGLRRTATMTLHANVPGAEIFLNQNSIGVTDDRGAFTVVEMSPGYHTYEVRAPGYKSYRRSVKLTPGQHLTDDVLLDEDRTRPLTVVAPPKPEPEPEESAGRPLAWLGWTAVGVSAVMVGATAYSWLRISAIQDDPTYTEYRAAAPQGTNDVCAAASRGDTFGNPQISSSDVLRVQSLCSEADTLEVLQWVFLGTAVAAGGLGAYLLLRPIDAPDHAEDQDSLASRLRITPRVGMGRAGLDLSLRF